MLLTHIFQLLEKYVKVLCSFDVSNMFFLALISASLVAEIIQKRVQLQLKLSPSKKQILNSQVLWPLKAKKKKNNKKIKTPKTKRADAVN